MPLILFEQESENRGRVFLIHNMPDDPVHGLPDEVKKTGIHVDYVPEPPEPQRGKRAVLYCNPSTKELWYEMEDRPLTMEELLEEQNEKLDLLMMAFLEQEGIL